jgi:hypothetical protein
VLSRRKTECRKFAILKCDRYTGFMSCKCAGKASVNVSCRATCKRRCPTIRRCKFKAAKWTCPWSPCAGANVLTCCR